MPEDAGRNADVPTDVRSHAAWSRLEDQLKWYDGRSVACQRRYKVFKIVQVILALLIPLIAPLSWSWVKWAMAVSGAGIALLEAVQQMNQYAMSWISYRSTAERLKHEKYLFLSAAGPYRALTMEERLIALAERVEEHVSTEHANWFNETTRTVARARRQPE